MSAPSFFYSIVSRVAAVVLLIAGGLKAREFLTPPALDQQWTALGQTALELLFGAWLLVGLYPRWSRILALAGFAVFLNVALAGAVQGQPSCGCFGKVSVRPWSAAGLDALLVVGLVFSPTTQMWESTLRITRMRWFGFVISAFMVLLVVGWPLVRSIRFVEQHIPSIASEDMPTGKDMPTGVDTSALERVIHDVEQNHAALHTIVCTTEKIITQHPVKRTGTFRFKKGNEWVEETGTRMVPEKEKKTRHVMKSWIRGDEVREDSLYHSEGGSGGEILLSSKGKRIQYSPEIHQAWISASEFADEGLGNSIDLRCAGFHPPLKSIADWLKHRCKVLNAGLAKDKAGREVIRLRARVKKHDNFEYEVIADFVPAMNCTPSRVVYYFLPDGGILTVTDIEYQQVGSDSAWFPVRITERCFPRNTTSDPDAPTGQNLSEESTVKVLSIGHGVQDEDFDPKFPAETRLVGNLSTQLSTGEVAARVSQLTRTEPQPVTEDATLSHRGKAPPASFWPLVAGMDVLLVGFCLVFRKRLAF